MGRQRRPFKIHLYASRRHSRAVSSYNLAAFLPSGKVAVVPSVKKESPGLSAHATPHDGEAAERRHDEIVRSSRAGFRRDRDRIFNSRAFLMLDQKTELYTEPTGGQSPSRLLYAMRAAATARTLAELLHLNVDVTETAVLAQRLGLPPFGRAGTETLAALMASHGGFDPISQSLRIVDELEAKYPEFNGLNLSHAVRESLRPATKQSLSLETQGGAWAARIATLCLDVELGLEAGLIDEARLSDFPLWREIAEPTDRHYPKLEPIRRRHYHFRNLLSMLVDRVVEHSHSAVGKPSIGLNPRFEAGFETFERWVAAETRRNPFDALYRDRAACLEELFAILVHRPHLLGESALVRLKKEGVHRAVADFLAQRGDRELLRLRREVVGEREIPAGRAAEQSLLL